MKNVGILGATGYAGQQLLGLLRTHPQIKIEFIASHSYEGQEFSSIYENYSYEFNKVCISNTQVEKYLNKIDLLFIALPHGKAFEITNAVATHRHTPEIEQEAGKISKKEITLTFTPHLVPMNRGILSVIYAKLREDIEEKELKKIYSEEYHGDKFIRIKDTLPETRWVKGSNYCDITVRVDKRTGRVIIISAIDNLMKGAAGQAIQNMNAIFGFEEATGIDFISIFP
ncbi:Asd/ArgC dimerization domain-containing protein [Fusobacteria bacterium ZRK30]|nr:Asd/ArgC dimerization domain-containing protein [Fusobacteria bacterium ZRK30]